MGVPLKSVFICNKIWVIKLFEGLLKFMRVSREGLALLEYKFMIICHPNFCVNLLIYKRIFYVLF